jgi:hypothetical protein
MSEKSLIVYGAGKDAARAAAEKFRSERREIACFADKDENKWHKPAFEGGPIVLPPDEALAKYPDFSLYLSTIRYPLKFQIEEELVERCSVRKDRIENYEEYSKHFSCPLLETRFHVSENVCYFCCVPHNAKHQLPKIHFSRSDDFGKIVEKFIDIREATVAGLNGQGFSACEGCKYVRFDYYKKRKIRTINLDGSNRCNFKCAYCTIAGKTNFVDVPDIQYYCDLINYMLERKYIDNTAYIVFCMGEFFLFPDYEKIIPFFEKFDSSVLTNASKYDERINTLLKTKRGGMSSGRFSILTSLDAGTRETFKRVKGVDMFDKVSSNLIRYGGGGGRCINLKYILMPDMNDNKTDIDGFYQICSEVGPECVVLAGDMYDKKAWPERTADIARYFLDKGYTMGFKMALGFGQTSDENCKWLLEEYPNLYLT